MKTIVFLLVLLSNSFSIEFDDIHYSCDKVLVRHSYTTCYNTTVKMPNYSFYKVTNTSADKTMTRLIPFYVDPDLSKNERSSVDDYLIYDKGHLAPASLMDNNEISRKEANYLSNIVPQDPYFNRFGAWRDIERLEQILVNRYDIEIISGAVFTYNTIPTYMYKVIIIPTTKQYVILYYTNTSIDKDYKYDYIITLEEFKQKTNIEINLTDYKLITKDELLLIKP